MATMEAKELLEAAKQINKAMESGDPTSTLYNLLKPLESVKVTEDSLRKSKIGIAVTRVRTHSKDPKVNELAGKLVNRWKAEVAKQKASAGGAASPATQNKGASSVAKDARVSSSSPAPGVKTASEPKKEPQRVPLSESETDSELDSSKWVQMWEKRLELLEPQ